MTKRLPKQPFLALPKQPSIALPKQRFTLST
jgi:hypothetical protein